MSKYDELIQEVLKQEIESNTDSIGTARLLSALGVNDYIEALQIMLGLLNKQDKQNAAMRSALEAIAHKITTSGKPRIEILNDCHSLARKALNE